MNKECTYCKKLFNPDEYGNIGLKPDEDVSICPTCIMQTCAGRLSRVQIIQHSRALLKLLYHCFDFAEEEDTYHELGKIVDKLTSIQDSWIEEDKGKK